ncbi:hypothetical protein TSMEX_004120 [Taenia solium]|eukprot:TsM_000753400 transcript=TsM_000753400 gene=TsM_000753400
MSTQGLIPCNETKPYVKTMKHRTKKRHIVHRLATKAVIVLRAPSSKANGAHLDNRLKNMRLKVRS